MLACALEQLSVLYLATFHFWVKTSRGWEEKEHECLKIVSLLIYGNFTMWNFLFTLEFQIPNWFLCWNEMEMQKVVLTWNASTSWKSQMWPFFCFVITYYILVYCIVSFYMPKSSEMLGTWIWAFLSAWHCQQGPEVNMMECGQDMVSRAEHLFICNHQHQDQKMSVWKHCSVTHRQSCCNKR